GYVPSLPLAVVGLTLYGLVALSFWFRFFTNGPRSQLWMLVLCFATSDMAAGFVARILRHNNPSTGVYLGETLLLLLAPVAFLAQDYLILPRLVKWLSAEGVLFVNPAKVVKIFAVSDTVTSLLQTGGAGLTVAASNKNLAKIGSRMVLAGFIIQALLFGTFTLMALVFGLRVLGIVYRPLGFSFGRRVVLRQGEDWRVLWFAMMWTTVGILIRWVYRIFQYAQGYEGYLATHEGFFYCLDALPLLLAISVYIFVWPPLLLNSACRFGADNISMIP
ncbi:RTA1 like protein, partial [Fistulina hepatica ATCC 64428]